MGASCLWLPATPPSGTGEVSFAQAGSMLAKADFRAFLLISLVIAGLMQFYFLGTGRFMQEMGISGKVISGAMAIAQVAQALATWFILNYFKDRLGFKWTLVIGAASWVIMYAIYVVGRPRWLIVAAQSFHGLAYVLFIIAGQMYANDMAPGNMRSSVQAMVFAATMGIGVFLGTQAAGIIMDRFTAAGKFQWRPIWLVPGVVGLAGVVALAAFFSG
jgi:MFS family permease